MSQEDHDTPAPSGAPASSNAASTAADTPQGSASTTTAAKPQPEGWAPPKRSVLGIFAIVFLLVVAVLAVLYAWRIPPFGLNEVTTDNAYVRGRTTLISPQVSGYVTEVLVKDFQSVTEGQPLVVVDDRTYQQRVAQGTAGIAQQSSNLDNALQNLRSSEAQVRLQTATIANARAQQVRAAADLQRIDDLVGDGSVSKRERDQAVAALRQADAAVRQAEAQHAIATEQVRSVQVAQGGLQAQVENAKAAHDLARIDLEHTVIRAPRDGRLGEVTVQLGQLVAVGTQMMYLVPSEHWVIANFKESQVTHIRVGQPATVRFDVLGGARLHGQVESISPAAGSEYSVIRPDTGSGNFVRVPQRVAVRIHIDPDQAATERLGPGMSAIATVHTAHGAEEGR